MTDPGQKKASSIPQVSVNKRTVFFFFGCFLEEGHLRALPFHSGVFGVFAKQAESSEPWPTVTIVCHGRKMSPGIGCVDWRPGISISSAPPGLLFLSQY